MARQVTLLLCLLLGVAFFSTGQAQTAFCDNGVEVLMNITFDINYPGSEGIYYSLYRPDLTTGGNLFYAQNQLVTNNSNEVVLKSHCLDSPSPSSLYPFSLDVYLSSNGIDKIPGTNFLGLVIVYLNNDGQIFNQSTNFVKTFSIRTMDYYVPQPSAAPTSSPSASPTHSPSAAPSASPSRSPTNSPSAAPTSSPSASPTNSPTAAPSASPSRSPTNSPSASPTAAPSASPSRSPTNSPSASPTVAPSASPSRSPTNSPSASPTVAPSASPSKSPTAAPSASPSRSPTNSPSASPTAAPSASPSRSPTNSPSASPTLAPSASPSRSPTNSPSASPTLAPSAAPSNSPSVSPTVSPSSSPTSSPTKSPTPRCPPLHHHFTVEFNGMDAGASFDLFGFDSEFTVLTKNESMTVSSWSICLPTADYVFDPCCSSPSCTFWSSGNYSLYVEDSLIFESNRYHPYLFAIDAIPAPTTSPTSSPTLSPTAAPITLCADPNLRRYDVVLDGDNMNFQLYELGVNDTLITSHNAPGRYSGCVTDGKEYFWSLASLSMSPIRMKLFIDFSDIDYSYLENNGDTASSTFVLPFYADSPTAAPSVAPTSCSDHLFEIEISPDLFPEEISWVLLQTRPTNELVISSSNQSKPLTTQVCLTPGEYSFGIMDLFKDGICGAFGTGSYSLYLNGAMLHSGCDFGISDAYVFVIEPSEPTASPSRTPTATPSASPSASPSAAPSLSPSRTPTSSPSASPTYFCPSLDEYHMVLWLSGVNVTYTVFKFNEDDSTSVVFNASSSGQHDFCLSNGSYIHSMSTTSNLLARSRLTSVFFDEFEIVQQEIAINAVVKVVSDYFDLPYDSPPTVSPPVVVCNSTGLENTLSWSITPDYFPRDISWQLLNLQGAGAIASGSYGDSNHLEGSYCLANGRYSFGVMDKAADGLCCQWGPAGYWTLKMNGQSIIPSGIVSGDYLASYVVRFTVTDGVISNVVEI